MRVLVCSFENPVTFMGGVEVHAVELVRALRGLGVEAELATRAPDEGPPPEDPWDVPVHWLPVPLPRGSLPAYHHRRLTLPAFRRRVRRLAGDFDVVHAQNEAGLGAIGHAPTVTTVHTDVVSDYRVAKKPLPQGLPQRLLVGYDVLRWRRWARGLAASIAVSPVTGEAIRDAFGMDPVVIPNGVPDDPPVGHQDARDRMRWPFQQTLLYLGRLAHIKRPDRVIDALPHLSDDVGLCMGGKGAQRQALEAQARKLGVADRVRWLGFVPEEEKRATLAAADAFVLPSRHEGQPITLLEALHEGTPVVLSQMGWLPEELHPWAHEAPIEAGRDRLVEALEVALGAGRADEAPVPTWREVAQRTSGVYDAVVG